MKDSSNNGIRFPDQRNFLLSRAFGHVILIAIFVFSLNFEISIRLSFKSFSTFNSFILGNIVVDAWILRLQCKSESAFDVNVTNSVLQGSLLTKRTVSEVQECFDMCTLHPQCKSVNYQDEAIDNCELNSRIKDYWFKAHFLAKPGWTYYTTNYSLKNVSLRM